MATYQGNCILISIMISRPSVCFFSLQAPTLTMEGGRLMRPLNLMAGQDFETVPEPVWRALYHWYGANLSLPRPVRVPAFIDKMLVVYLNCHFRAFY